MTDQDPNQVVLNEIASVPEESRPEARQVAVSSVSRYKARLLTKSEAPRTLADLDAILPRIQWLWPLWLPHGFVTLLVGQPGVGKSALALALTQCILQGKAWPDGVQNNEKGGLVVWADTESTHAITLERATDWKISKDKLVLPATDSDLLAELRLDTDKGWWAIQKEAHRKDTRLIVIDSLRGSFRGSENRSEIVGFMTRLSELATKASIPLLLVHHLRKRGLMDGSRINLDRVRGSSTIVQMARCIWAVDKINEDDAAIRCQQIKNNLARFPEPFGFEITEQGVVYIDAPIEPQIKTPRDVARDWLLEVLENGPMPASDIFEQADAIGLSKRTIQRAKNQQGINHVYKDGTWYWETIS